MSSKNITLVGQLIGGFVGPGAETTGFELQLPEIDLDFTGFPGRPNLTGGEVYLVSGDFHDRWYPLRGRTKVLRVKALVKSALQLPRERLKDSVFLQGTVLTDVVRAGGETTGTVISGAAPQVELSRSEDSALVNKDVLAAGHFTLVSRPLLGLQFVFKATKIIEAKSRKTADSQPLTTEKASSTSRDSAVGYSNDFSLQEAILDAVKQLPGSEIPDWLTEVHIESIDAEFGGIAGLSRLKVSISSPKPPTS